MYQIGGKHPEQWSGWYRMVRDDLQYFERLQAELAEKVPPEHLAFLRGLEVTFQIGDYLFVHAGVRPNIPIEQQSPDDLLWIREPFLSDLGNHGKLVVHGHTPVEAPMHAGNRVAVDTGAGYGRPASALAFEAGAVHVLTEAGRAPLFPSV